MADSDAPRRRQCCRALRGRIMMLPAKERVQDRLPPAATKIDDGVFKHPVIVLSAAKGIDGLVAVLVVTSFNETSIEIRLPNPQQRQRYLPIHPSSHPDTSDMLTIGHGKKLKKHSYVKTSRVIELPLEILDKYWHDNHLHLRPESYNRLRVILQEQRLVDDAGRIPSLQSVERLLMPQPQPTRVPLAPIVGQRGVAARQRQAPVASNYSVPVSSTPLSYGTVARNTAPELPWMTTRNPPSRFHAGRDSSNPRSTPVYRVPDYHRWQPAPSEAPSNNLEVLRKYVGLALVIGLIWFGWQHGMTPFRYLSKQLSSFITGWRQSSQQTLVASGCFEKLGLCKDALLGVLTKLGLVDTV